MSKKTVLFHSNYPGLVTGFARNMKSLLSYLYKTDKYNLVMYANGLPYSHPEFEKWPWKTIGSLPMNQQEIDLLNKEPHKAREASYGGYYIDRVINEVKPDVYIGIEDIWGFNKYYEKNWYKNINSLVWTTLDSLPILPDAVDYAKNVKNFWVWASFAEKALKEMGQEFNHVKTVHGCIDSTPFKPISNSEKLELRKRFNISPTTTIFSFVSRNQLRKLFWANLEGFKKYKKLNPQADVKLLFHTHWSEGWPLDRTIKEMNLNPNDILTTYICRNCREFEIKPFTGENKDCRFCGTKGCSPNQQFPMGAGQITTNVVHGTSEEDLARIYGISDAYLHLMTSGGQEYGLVESLLCGLPMATVAYSCGTDFTDQSFIHSIEFNKTKECGTNFDKVVPNTTDVAKFIKKIVEMPEEKRREIGKKGRDWALANFDTNVIGKVVEEFIDNCPAINYDFKEEKKIEFPNAIVPNIPDDKEWIKALYKNILNLPDVKDDDKGLNDWLASLKNGVSREQIEGFFRQVAKQNNDKNAEANFENLFDKDDYGKRILIVQPESIGDIIIVTSLLKSCKEQYPWANIYFATKKQYFELLDANEYIHKVIEYNPNMESEMLMSGAGNHTGFVEILFLPFIPTQRILAYLQNGKSNPAFKLDMPRIIYKADKIYS